MADLGDLLRRNGERELQNLGRDLMRRGVNGAVNSIMGGVQQHRGGSDQYQPLSQLGAREKIAMQTQLKATGDYTGAIDGDFGGGSQRAFNAYAERTGNAQIVKQGGETYIPASTMRALSRAGRRGEVQGEQDIDVANLELSADIKGGEHIAPHEVAQAPQTPVREAEGARGKA